MCIFEGETDKASFLDLDRIPVYDPNDKEQHIFGGKRIGPRQRLYHTKDGRKLILSPSVRSFFI